VCSVFFKTLAISPWGRVALPGVRIQAAEARTQAVGARSQAEVDQVDTLALEGMAWILHPWEGRARCPPWGWDRAMLPVRVGKARAEVLLGRDSWVAGAHLPSFRSRRCRGRCPRGYCLHFSRKSCLSSF